MTAHKYQHLGSYRPVVTPGVIERRSVGVRWRRVKRRAGEWMWRTGRRWMQEAL